MREIRHPAMNPPTMRHDGFDRKIPTLHYYIVDIPTRQILFSEICLKIHIKSLDYDIYFNKISCKIFMRIYKNNKLYTLSSQRLHYNNVNRGCGGCKIFNRLFVKSGQGCNLVHRDIFMQLYCSCLHMTYIILYWISKRTPVRVVVALNF